MNIWEKNRGVVRTTKGGWKAGQGIFCHGLNLMEDVVGKKSYMQLVVLNATGRLIDRPLGNWFDAIHICLSWPDPRIWCNTIGALGGSVRVSPVAATMAGTLTADSRAYGIKPLVEGLDFIQRALSWSHDGMSAADIIDKECQAHGGKLHVMGYARPIAKGDERVVAMEAYAQELGFHERGVHLKLAYDIESCLLSSHNESMNIVGYMSAFLSDFNFTSQEVYRIFATWVSSGVTACYQDTVEKPENTFMPMQCNDINYVGSPLTTLSKSK